MRDVGNDWLALELHELIRLNQLVRRETDLVALGDWIAELSVLEQCAVARTAFELAFQAGNPFDFRDEALAAVGMTATDDSVRRIDAAVSRGMFDGYAFHAAFTNLTPAEVGAIIRYCVSLFGFAERRAFEAEDESSCNHWWHRDLTDPAVVDAILADPEYFYTSRRDDRSVEGRTDGHAV